MAIDVYISPSMQTQNTYAAGGTNEEVQYNRIVDSLEAEFARCGISYKRGGRATSLPNRCNESNAAGARVHLSIHTNAVGSNIQNAVRGTEVYYYRDAAVSKRAAQFVLNELAALGLKSRGLKSTNMVNWHEPNNTNGVTVYCEVEFHDNPDGARLIIDRTGDIAAAICKGCAGTLGRGTSRDRCRMWLITRRNMKRCAARLKTSRRKCKVYRDLPINI
jgi:hypothetical protein